MNPWLLGGGAVAALLLFGGKKAQAAVITPFPSLPASERDRDLDALANMLITETGFNKSREEMAQIVFVALNRAKRYKLPIREVVDPGRRKFPAWNTGAPYKRLFEGAPTRSKWLAARNFAASVMSGAYRNLGKRSFVHPKSPRFDMPCDTRGGKWGPSYVAGYGTRCIPKWAHGGTVVGSGLFT
jgi:hypothetical protein